MNTPDFLKILHQPELMESEQVDSLEEVVNSFPYFQAARVLYLKGLKNQNSFRYNLNLKNTAAHTTDRSVLFHFITSDTFLDSLAQKKESDFIESIELVDLQVIENIENQVGKTDIEAEVDRFIAETKKLEEENKAFYFEIDEEEKIDEEQIDFSAYSGKIFDTDLSINFEPTTESDESETHFSIDEPEELINESTENTLESSDEEVEENVAEILLKAADEKDGHKPVHFQKGEMHSFMEWLQLSSFKPIDRSKEPDIDLEKAKKQDLIDRFISTNPKISKISDEPVNKDMEATDELETDAIMTETLAHLYEQQKKYDSAIKAYEILGLKFPEKSSFFADQIERLKKLSKK